MLIAGKRELENIEHVQALTEFLAGEPIVSSHLDQKVEFNSQQERKVSKPQEQATRPGETAFDRSIAAVAIDVGSNLGFPVFQRSLQQRWTGNDPGTRQYSARNLPDRDSKGRVNYVRD